PDLPYINWAVSSRAPALVLVVVFGAWIFVDHHSLVSIHLTVVPPIGIGRDVNRAFFSCDQTTETLQHEPRHHLFEIDNLKATGVVGVGPIEHEKIGKARQHRAEIGAGAVLGPKLLDPLTAPAADLHRPQEVVGFESGGIHDDIE